MRIPRESPLIDYAGFWIRLLALAIDGIILGVLTQLIIRLWSMASGAGFWGGQVADPLLPDAVPKADSALWALQAAVLFVMVVAYFIGFWGWRGQTPGKMLMRVKVVRFNGSEVDWGGAVMRFLGYIISGLLVLIGFVWVAFDGRRQGLHDKIADTFVITVPKRRSALSETGP
jgi:uncharacterized RDD family membrane protein YckC